MGFSKLGIISIYESSTNQLTSLDIQYWESTIPMESSNHKYFSRNPNSNNNTEFTLQCQREYISLFSKVL